LIFFSNAAAAHYFDQKLVDVHMWSHGTVYIRKWISWRKHSLLCIWNI